MNKASTVTTYDFGIRWDLFPAHLINNHEGEIITEESLQSMVVGMLKSDDYKRIVAESKNIVSQVVQEPIGQIRTDIERVCAIWFGNKPPHGTLIYAAPTQAIAQTAPTVAGEAWLPIETAPFDVDFIVFGLDGIVRQGHRSTQYKNDWTHWMPMFAAPSQGAKQ